MNIWLAFILILFSFLFGFIFGWFYRVIYAIAREQLKAAEIKAKTPWRKIFNKIFNCGG